MKKAPLAACAALTLLGVSTPGLGEDYAPRHLIYCAILLNELSGWVDTEENGFNYGAASADFATRAQEALAAQGADANGVRSLLAEIQAEAAADWAQHMDGVENAFAYGEEDCWPISRVPFVAFE